MIPSASEGEARSPRAFLSHLYAIAQFVMLVPVLFTMGWVMCVLMIIGGWSEYE